jgi:hypothetical protein
MNQLPVTAISVLLTAFFLFASTVKIFGWPKAIFDKQLAWNVSAGPIILGQSEKSFKQLIIYSN